VSTSLSFLSSLHLFLSSCCSYPTIFLHDEPSRHTPEILFLLDEFETCQVHSLLSVVTLFLLLFSGLKISWNLIIHSPPDLCIIRSPLFFFLFQPTPHISPSNFTIDAETLTREAKQTRLLHTPWARVVQTQGHIFDHFIIVTGDKESGKRHIVYTYPPAPLTLQNLEFFTFPDGYDSPHLPKTRAMDQQGSDVFVRHLKEQQRSFIFLLTNASNEIFYGICVLDDMLPQPPLFLNSQGTVSMPLAYAFVSRYPFFSLFFHTIYSLLSIEEADQRAKRQPQDRFKGMLQKLYDCKVPPPGHEIDFVVQNTEEFRRSFGEIGRAHV